MLARHPDGAAVVAPKRGGLLDPTATDSFQSGFAYRTSGRRTGVDIYFLFSIEVVTNCPFEEASPIFRFTLMWHNVAYKYLNTMISASREIN